MNLQKRCFSLLCLVLQRDYFNLQHVFTFRFVQSEFPLLEMYAAQSEIPFSCWEWQSNDCCFHSHFELAMHRTESRAMHHHGLAIAIFNGNFSGREKQADKTLCHFMYTQFTFRLIYMLSSVLICCASLCFALLCLCDWVCRSYQRVVNIAVWLGTIVNDWYFPFVST